MTLARTAGFKSQRWTHVGDMLVSALLMVSYTFWQYCISIHENSMDRFTHTHMHAHLHTCMHRCTLHTQMYMHAYTHACTHACIHAHNTHTLAHIFTKQKNIKTFTRILVCIIMEAILQGCCMQLAAMMATNTWTVAKCSVPRPTSGNLFHPWEPSGQCPLQKRDSVSDLWQPEIWLQRCHPNKMQTDGHIDSSMPTPHPTPSMQGLEKNLIWAFVTLRLTLWGYTFVKVYVTCISLHARWELQWFFVVVVVFVVFLWHLSGTD